MPVRHSLLALPDAGPMHGYGLKTAFESSTGDVWPLNVGQVDGLIFQAEAEARWLGMCEARLARQSATPGTGRRQPEIPAERAAERSS